MSSAVNVTGVRLYKTSEEDIRAYANNAEVRDKEIEKVEFLKLRVNPKYRSGSSINVSNIQYYNVNVRNVQGRKSASVALSRSWDGTSAGHSLEFTPDSMGVLVAYIPNSKHNREVLIASYAAGDFLEIMEAPEGVQKEVQRKGSDKAKKRREMEEAAELLATVDVEKANAPTILSLREKFGDNLNGILEYENAFGKDIARKKGEYLREFLAAGKVTKKIPKETERPGVKDPQASTK